MSASVSLVLLVGNGIIKMFLKKNKHRKIVLLACSKVNSIERIIFKALEDARISHEEFILTINREKIILDRMKASEEKTENEMTVKGID